MSVQYNEKSDDELMDLCKQGSYQAFEEIYDRYCDQLLNFAWKFSGDYQVATDAVQETFKYVIRKMDEYEAKGSFKSLVYKVTKNNCLDLLKKDRKETSTDLKDDSLLQEQDGTSPAEQIEADEKVEIIKQLINEMSETYREVLLLRVVGGFKYKEIANMTDIKMGTVMSRLHNGLQKLRDRIKEQYPELLPETFDENEE